MEKNKSNLCIEECKQVFKEYFKNLISFALVILIPFMFFIFCIIIGGYYLILGGIFAIFVYIPSVKCFGIYLKYKNEEEIE